MTNNTNKYKQKLTELGDISIFPGKSYGAFSGLVLVVDDEPIMQRIAVKVLTDEGYDVLVAEDGEIGIQIFKSFSKQIRLVVLDMVLPKISGKDVYLEMKKLNPDLKVLLNSGFKEDDRVKQVLALGVRHFIEKPYSFDQLSKAVKKAIEN